VKPVEQTAIESQSEKDEIDSDEDVKLGNKLFDSEDGEEKYQILNLKDPQLARAIIDQESPELRILLGELQTSLSEANNKIQPTL
jgi:hypothetical protein